MGMPFESFGDSPADPLDMEGVVSMENEQQSCTSQESRTCGAAEPPPRSAELQSWIDNVIVPILVQEILQTPRAPASTPASVPDYI